MIAYYTERISSQGLRDREFAPKAPGEFRILVLGDSFIDGMGLSAEDTIPRQLEAQLRGDVPGKNITVMNGGVSAYAPWQERIFLRERCFPLEPDLVIYALYPENDVAGSLERLGEYLDSYNTGYARRMLEWTEQDLWVFGFETWVARHSALYCKLRQAYEFRPFLREAYRQVRFFGPDPARYVLPPCAPRPFQLEICLRNWYPELEKAWGLLEQDVLGIQSDCAQWGGGGFLCLRHSHGRGSG